MTVSIINNLLTRVTSLRHAVLSGWASLVIYLWRKPTRLRVG